MALGMTYDQYWYGDVHMVRAFYKADRLRQKRMNEEAWLFGAYVYKALDASICNAFREKGTPVKYPEAPVWKDEWLGEEERKESFAEREEREEKEAVFAQAWMQSMVTAGATWGKKK